MTRFILHNQTLAEAGVHFRDLGTLRVDFSGRIHERTGRYIGDTDQPAGIYYPGNRTEHTETDTIVVDVERRGQEIDKWDRYFLRLARESAMMSQDPSSQIGAVLVQPEMTFKLSGERPDTKGRIVATGFNGFPPGIDDDERWDDRNEKYKLVVHAETNAIIQAGRDRAKGATLYMYGYTSAPCDNCTKHTIAAGIRRVVGGGIPTPERWQANLRAAEDTLREARIPLVMFDLWDFTDPDEWGKTHQEVRLIAGEDL